MWGGGRTLKTFSSLSMVVMFVLIQEINLVCKFCVLRVRLVFLLVCSECWINGSKCQLFPIVHEVYLADEVSGVPAGYEPS